MRFQRLQMVVRCRIYWKVSDFLSIFNLTDCSIQKAHFLPQGVDLKSEECCILMGDGAYSKLDLGDVVKCATPSSRFSDGDQLEVEDFGVSWI